MELAHRAFEQQAAATPTSTAVIFGDTMVTYQQLDQMANALAHRLASVKLDEPVGLHVDRSVEMVVGFLGILKAGGALLPLDPSYPADRLSFMLADSRVRTIVANGPVPVADAQSIIDVGQLSRVAAPPASGPSAENLAYVIYTSGSAGRPKGVMVPHRGLVNLARAQIRVFRITPTSRVLQFAAFSFDAFVSEVLIALLSGATLVVATQPQLMPGAELIDTLRRHAVTKVTLPPSVLSVLPPNDLPALKTVVSAGEALSAELYGMWSASRHFVNAYGPTEVTVCATMAEEVIQDGRVSIGIAIDNARMYVLDDELRPVAAGHKGELYVSSIGLARGYLGRPALTAERFVPDPFSTTPGARMYRTGDRVRTLPSGATRDLHPLEFLGRADNQVKIRGYRIEVGEIEFAIREQPGVRDVAVAIRENERGQRSMVAFVILAPPATTTELQTCLARQLPDYMIPTFEPVERFPLTPNNKLDREALLRDYLPAAAAASTDATGPRNEAERLVAKVWGEILGFEVTDVDADFFALGGDSLKGAMVANSLQEILQESVYIVAVFDCPTIAQLAVNLLVNYPDAMARVTGMASAAPPRAIAKTTPNDVVRLRELITRVATRTGSLPVRTKNPRAVFLLSPPRSGSTLLRVMLAGNPALFVPQEVGLLGFDRLGDKAIVANGYEWMAEGVIRAVMDIKQWSVDQAKAFLAEHERSHLPSQKLYRMLQDWVAPRILVDKSTTYALDAAVLQRAEAEFEAPYYIHLMRHPCAIIKSFENIRMEQFFFGSAEKQLPPAPQLAELIWYLCTSNIVSFLREIPASRQCELRYEDAVRDPAGQMNVVCRNIGISYDSGMVRPYHDGERKMLDGIYKDAASRQVGDPNFMKHSAIDPARADAWRGSIDPSTLGDMARALATTLGYES